MKALINWLDDRTGVRKLTREALFELVPGGARWRYVWGSALTFAILVQFITGIMLWMFYSPSANSAWESVYYLQEEVKGGDLLRGIHHWMSQFMIVLLVLHLVQVVVDGAYKAPREFNFWFGLGLLGITLALGLTGYLLPWDQKGFWATEVATNIVGGTPVIGDQLKQIVIGGSEAGHHTLTRFFALHAGVLPAALVGLIVLHIYLFRKHGITPAPPKTARSTRHFWWLALLVMLFSQGMLIWNWQYVAGELGIGISIVTGICLLRVIYLQLRQDTLEDEDSKKPRRGDAYFWPDQVFRDAIACAAVLGAVLFFVWQFGTDLSAPADPSEAYSAARPDWYYMALFALLKEFDLIVGAFVIPGVVAAIVFLMPFIGRAKVGHYFNLVFLAAVLAGFVYYTFVAFRHDWGSKAHAASVDFAHRDAERTKHLAGLPAGIPPEGALALVRKDFYLQGPRLFAKHCASCHSYHGHDGTGRERTQKQTASDLGIFPNREWAAGVLNAESFAHPDFFGTTKFVPDGKMVKFLRKKSFTDLPSEELEDMAIALSAEAELPSQSEMDKADAERIERGRESIAIECLECHEWREEEPDEQNGPILTGYGGDQWLFDFIKNPAHEKFYGSKSKMSVFGPKYEGEGDERKLVRPATLTDVEIGYLVQWMLGAEDETAEVAGSPEGNSGGQSQ